MTSEMYTNELATKLDMRVSLVIHHLKKMEDLELLIITNKKIKRKGQEHRFFKIDSDIFVTVDKTKKELKEKGFLKKLFKDGIKFASIGIVSIITLFLSNYDPNKITRGSSSISEFNFFTDKISLELTYVSVAIAITIVLVGLFLVFKCKKKN